MAPVDGFFTVMVTDYGDMSDDDCADGTHRKSVISGLTGDCLVGIERINRRTFADCSVAKRVHAWKIYDIKADT